MKNYELIQIVERYDKIVAKATTAYALGIVYGMEANIDTFGDVFVVKVKATDNSGNTHAWRAESNASVDMYEIFFNEDQADELEEYLDEILGKARREAEQKVKVIDALKA